MSTEMNSGRRFSRGSRASSETPIPIPEPLEQTDDSEPTRRVSSQKRSGSPAVSPSDTQGVIRGQVVSDNQPVSNATVAVSAGPTHRDIAALTDAQGRFHLGGLTPGEYQIAINKSGYGSETLEVVVTPGQAAQVSVRLVR